MEEAETGARWPRGGKEMYELMIALTFVGMVLAPCVLALVRLPEVMAEEDYLSELDLQDRISRG